MNSFSGEDQKWILYKHTSNFDIVKQTAIEIKTAPSASLGVDERRALLRRLKKVGLYVGRNPSEPLDSIQHRVNTLIWYMFGYREKLDSGLFLNFSMNLESTKV
jgi:hypothetical protein